MSIRAERVFGYPGTVRSGFRTWAEGKEIKLPSTAADFVLYSYIHT